MKTNAFSFSMHRQNEPSFQNSEATTPHHQRRAISVGGPQSSATSQSNLNNQYYSPPQKSRYSISYVPGVVQHEYSLSLSLYSLTPYRIKTPLTLEEAQMKIVLLCCEVERTTEANYKLVKENEILRAQNGPSDRDLDLETKLAIVLAENEKLIQVVDDLYQNHLVEKSIDVAAHKQEMENLMKGFEIKRVSSESENSQYDNKALQHKIKSLEMDKAGLLRELEVLKIKGIGVDKLQTKMNRYKETMKALLEENEKLINALKAKTIETKRSKGNLLSGSVSDRERWMEKVEFEPVTALDMERIRDGNEEQFNSNREKDDVDKLTEKVEMLLSESRRMWVDIDKKPGEGYNSSTSPSPVRNSREAGAVYQSHPLRNSRDTGIGYTSSPLRDSREPGTAYMTSPLKSSRGPNTGYSLSPLTNSQDPGVFSKDERIQKNVEASPGNGYYGSPLRNSRETGVGFGGEAIRRNINVPLNEGQSRSPLRISKEEAIYIGDERAGGNAEILLAENQKLKQKLREADDTLRVKIGELSVMRIDNERVNKLLQERINELENLKSSNEAQAPRWREIENNANKALLEAEVQDLKRKLEVTKLENDKLKLKVQDFEKIPFEKETNRLNAIIEEKEKQIRELNTRLAKTYFEGEEAKKTKAELIDLRRDLPYLIQTEATKLAKDKDKQILDLNNQLLKLYADNDEMKKAKAELTEVKKELPTIIQAEANKLSEDMERKIRDLNTLLIKSYADSDEAKKAQVELAETKKALSVLIQNETAKFRTLLEEKDQQISNLNSLITRSYHDNEEARRIKTELSDLRRELPILVQKENDNLSVIVEAKEKQIRELNTLLAKSYFDHDEFKRIKNELSEAKVKVTNLETANRQMNTTLLQRNREIDVIHFEATEARKTVSELMQVKQELVGLKTTLYNALNEKDQEIDHLKQEKGDKEGVLKALHEKEAQVHNLKQLLATKEKQLINYEELKLKIDGAQQRIEAPTNENSKLKEQALDGVEVTRNDDETAIYKNNPVAEAKKTSGDPSRARNEIGLLTEEKEELEKALQEKKREVAALKNELQNKGTHISEKEEILKLKEASLIQKETSILQKEKVVAAKEKTVEVLSEKLKEITKREETVALKESSLADLEKTVEEKEKNVVTQEETIVRQMNKIQEKQKALAKQEEVALEKITAITEKENVIKHKEEILVKQEKTIKAKEQVITTQEEAMAKKAKTISEKENSITQKEEIIAEKENAVEEKQKVVAQKEELIIKKSKAVEEKEKLVEHKEKQIISKEQVVSQKEKSIADKEAESVVELNIRVETLEKENESLKETLNQRVDEVNNKFRIVKEQKSVLENIIKEKEREIEGLQKDLEEKMVTIGSFVAITMGDEDTRAKIQSLENENKRLSEIMNDKEKDADKHEYSYNDDIDACPDLSGPHSARRNEKSRSEITRIRQENERLTRLIEDKGMEIRALKKDLESKDQVIDNFRGILSEIEATKKNMIGLVHERNKLNATVEEKDKALRNVNIQLMGINAEINGLKTSARGHDEEGSPMKEGSPVKESKTSRRQSTLGAGESSGEKDVEGQIELLKKILEAKGTLREGLTAIRMEETKSRRRVSLLEEENKRLKLDRSYEQQRSSTPRGSIENPTEILKIMQDNERLSGLVESREADIKGLKDAIEKKDAALENLRVEIVRADEEEKEKIEMLEAEITRLKALVDRFENIAQKNEASSENNEQTTTIKQENEQLVVALEEKQKEIDHLMIELETKEKSLDNMKGLQTGVAQLEKMIEMLLAENQRLKGLLDEKIVEAKRLREERNKLKKNQESKTISAKSPDEAIPKISSTLSGQISGKDTSATEAGSYRKSRTPDSASSGLRKGKISQLEVVDRDLDLVNTLEGENYRLISMLNEKENEINELKKRISEGSEINEIETKQLVKELNELEQRLEKATEEKKKFEEKINLLSHEIGRIQGHLNRTLIELQEEKKRTSELEVMRAQEIDSYRQQVENSDIYENDGTSQTNFDAERTAYEFQIVNMQSTLAVLGQDNKTLKDENKDLKKLCSLRLREAEEAKRRVKEVEERFKLELIEAKTQASGYKINHQDVNDINIKQSVDKVADQAEIASLRQTNEDYRREIERLCTLFEENKNNFIELSEQYQNLQLMYKELKQKADVNSVESLDRFEKQDFLGRGADNLAKNVYKDKELSKKNNVIKKSIQDLENTKSEYDEVLRNYQTLNTEASENQDNRESALSGVTAKRDSNETQLKIHNPKKQRIQKDKRSDLLRGYTLDQNELRAFNCDRPKFVSRITIKEPTNYLVRSRQAFYSLKGLNSLSLDISEKNARHLYYILLMTQNVSLSSLSLNLTEANTMTIKLIQKYLGSCAFLTSLSLKFPANTLISDEDVKTLCSGIKCLRSLSSLTLVFYGCNKIGSNGVKIISSTLTRLRQISVLHLNFNFCEKVDDDGVRHLIQSIGKLKQLSDLTLLINRCTRVNAKETLEILYSNLVKLQLLSRLTLCLLGCPQVSDDCLLRFFKSLKNLKYFTGLSTDGYQLIKSE